jgi:phosphoribosylaminoimidazole synthetase
MAGMYSNGEYDLAGFSVGAVRKSDMLPKSISPGDVLLALPSSGVHSNGYSLVRKCVERSGLAWDSLCPYPCAPEGLTLGESLLMPTRLYVKPVLPLIKRGITKGMAHITGGGLLDNIPRILPPHTAAFLDFKTAGYSLPPVFRWLQKYANLPQSELLRTFNCGIGMVLVVAPENEGAALAMLRETVPDAFAIGKLIARDGCPPVVTEGVLE